MSKLKTIWNSLLEKLKKFVKYEKYGEYTSNVRKLDDYIENIFRIIDARLSMNENSIYEMNNFNLVKKRGTIGHTGYYFIDKDHDDEFDLFLKYDGEFPCYSINRLTNIAHRRLSELGYMKPFTFLVTLKSTSIMRPSVWTEWDDEMINYNREYYMHLTYAGVKKYLPETFKLLSIRIKAVKIKEEQKDASTK